MSGHAVGWFMRNMERAFANMDNDQLNRVSETLNNEMEMRETGDAPDRPRGARSASRAGRERSRPPPGGAEEEEQYADEPGSRARSRSKAVTRRRAQWRSDHGLPPREEAAVEQEDEEVELGQADFSTDSPPRRAARWRHGGDKSQHVPRAAEPDVPVSYDSPGVARQGEGRLRVIGEGEVPALPNVPALPDDSQPMARLRDCLGMHERAYPPRVMRALRDLVEKRPKKCELQPDPDWR